MKEMKSFIGDSALLEPERIHTGPRMATLYVKAMPYAGPYEYNTSIVKILTNPFLVDALLYAETDMARMSAIITDALRLKPSVNAKDADLVSRLVTALEELRRADMLVYHKLVGYPEHFCVVLESDGWRIIFSEHIGLLCPNPTELHKGPIMSRSSRKSKFFQWLKKNNKHPRDKRVTAEGYLWKTLFPYHWYLTGHYPVAYLYAWYAMVGLDGKFTGRRLFLLNG